MNKPNLEITRGPRRRTTRHCSLLFPLLVHPLLGLGFQFQQQNPSSNPNPNPKSRDEAGVERRESSSANGGSRRRVVDPAAELRNGGSGDLQVGVTQCGESRVS